MPPPDAAFRLIKGATLAGGLAGGGGYLIGPDGPAPSAPCRHTLTLKGEDPFAFLFGLAGLGFHYRLDLRPRDSVLALYQIRDGIPVFLHHFSTAVDRNAVLTVDVFHSLVRIGLNGFQIIHAFVEPGVDSRIGFMPLSGNGFTMPDYASSPLLLPMPAWLCLGDGFSNARWRNRCFLSWPELVFGRRDDWFNGCVAAGNSRRVKQLAWEMAPLCGSGSIILAVGSDDLIEGERFEEFAGRLRSILQCLGFPGSGTVHLATLPPRASALAETREWSDRLIAFAREGDYGILDFHSWLLPRMDLMIRGEYPGAAAQALLAGRVAEALGLPLPEDPPSCCNRPLPGGMGGRALRKLHRWIGQRLEDFPGVLH